MSRVLSAVDLLPILALAKTRDNIPAAVSLTFLGVVAVWLLHTAFSAAFVLITLVMAASTLVVVAAAGLSDNGGAVEMRRTALASLGALPLLPGVGRRAAAASVHLHPPVVALLHGRGRGVPWLSCSLLCFSWPATWRSPRWLGP